MLIAGTGITFSEDSSRITINNRCVASSFLLNSATHYLLKYNSDKTIANASLGLITQYNSSSSTSQSYYISNMFSRRLFFVVTDPQVNSDYEFASIYCPELAQGAGTNGSSTTSDCWRFTTNVQGSSLNGDYCTWFDARVVHYAANYIRVWLTCRRAVSGKYVITVDVLGVKVNKPITLTKTF